MVPGPVGAARPLTPALSGGPALVAPDKFKGTLSATEVAAAMAAGLEGECDVCPIADGGEGTAAILLEALGGE